MTTLIHLTGALATITAAATVSLRHGLRPVRCRAGMPVDLATDD